MKKIRYILLILLLLILFPIKSYAIENVEISNVELVSKSIDAVIVSDPTIENLNLKTDIKFFKLNDFVEYKFIVKNNTDKELLINSVVNNSNDYTIYNLVYSTNNDYISPGEEVTVNLTITYKNEAPKEVFRSAKYDASSLVNLSLTDSFIKVPNTLFNGTRIIIIAVLFFIFIGLIILIKNTRHKSLYLILFGVLISIPYISKASISFNINIDSKITIEKVMPTSCTYNGELVQGAEFVQGRYTYHYKQAKKTDDGWTNIISDDDGWGVMMNDPDYTGVIDDVLCSTINDKPIVTMANMFNGSKATGIDMSSFDTSNVFDMSYMFNNVKSMTTYDFSSFDTSKLKYMSYTFYNNTGLTDLDLHYFDTPNLVYLNHTFDGCTSIKKLDLSSLTTSKITNYDYMLRQTNNLEEVNMSGFDFTNDDLSYGALYYVDVPIDKKLKKIDLTGSKYSNDMSYAFYYLGTVEELILTDADTTGVTNMTGLFYMSPNLKKLDLSTFDTSSVTDMTSMFNETNNLEEIDLSGWDTSSVTSMINMFNTCGVKNLDLSSFDLSGVTRFTSFLNSNDNLVSLTTPKNTGSNIIVLPGLFKDEDNNEYVVVDSESPTKEKLTLSKSLAIFAEGHLFGNKLKVLSGDQYGENNTNTAIETFIKSDSRPNLDDMTDKNLISVGKNAPIYAWYDNGNIYYYSDSDVVYFNPKSNDMFYGMTYINTIDLTGINSDYVMSMGYMFHQAGQYASSFTVLGLNNFNTSKVTNMKYLFSFAGQKATSWNIGDLSNWNVSKVTTMEAMFESAGEKANSFSIGNLSGWDTSKVTNMDNMFYSVGFYSTSFNSIGNLKVYAENIKMLLYFSKNFKGEISLYTKPTNYSSAFDNTATVSGSSVKVNYKSIVDNIDDIIATKSSNSNVVKGDVIN